MSEFVININENELQVLIQSEDTVQINKKKYSYDLLETKNHSFILKLNNRQYQIDLIEKKNGFYELLINNITINTTVRTLLEHKALKLIERANLNSNHHTEMKAPMPGMILKIKKKPGDMILMGESVLILEAMKMENDLKSPAAGIIKEILAKEGNAVEKGTKLFSIE
jgi:biotin carboxyl carrier protein